MTRCARPSGSPFAARPVCPTGCAATQPIPGPRPFGARASSVQKRSRRFCVEPRSVVLIPPLVWGDTYKQKARTSVQALSLNMAVRGGLTRFARPFGAARSLRTRSVQLAAPVVEPRSVVLIPLGLGDTYKQKARTSVQTLSLNMAVRGGIDSLCSPLRGSPFAAHPVCPTGCASCRTPVGGSHPPWFGGYI